MILSSKDQEHFFLPMDEIGLGERIYKSTSVLIKINLARPAEKGHPRTDMPLLADVIRYIDSYGGSCTVAEGANGYLTDNLIHAGLSETLTKYKVTVLDLDLEEAERILINGEEHFRPKCLKEYDVRIGLPAASKRPGMIFSNNVKLFVGAVPRRMYQTDTESVDWRPRVHMDLHTSVANIFRAIQAYSPFSFFINGGLAMDEAAGEFRFDEALIGDDGIELDRYVLSKYFSDHEMPEYVIRLSEFPHTL